MTVGVTQLEQKPYSIAYGEAQAKTFPKTILMVLVGFLISSALAMYLAMATTLAEAPFGIYSLVQPLNVIRHLIVLALARSIGQVYIEDLSLSTVPGNSTLGANAGWFRDDFGLSTGLTPDNTNGSQGNGSITEAKGSLWVKATSVPAPSGFFLLLLAIVALAISKMTSAQMAR